MFFETVLATTTREEFVANIFNKTHCLFRESNRLVGRLTTDDVDRYLNEWAGFLHHFVFAALAGESVHITKDEHSVLSQKAQFEDLYRRGATLKIDGFEVRNPQVAELCRDLELSLGGRTFAKGFLTPPGVPGFDVHFDAYDTFVMQLEGTKHWQVWAPLASMPGEDMARQVRPEELAEPIANYTLNPGDVLYMPSGYPHCARCTDEHSFHVTVGLNAWRADKIVEFLVRTLAVNNETVRQYVLPHSVDPDSEAKLKIALLDIAVALERVKPGELIESYRRSFHSNMPAVRNRGFRSASLASRATEESTYEFDAKAFHSFALDGERLIVRVGCSIPPSHPLHFQPPHLELPSFAQDDVSSVFKMKRPFKASDVEGSLDLASKSVLLEQLAKHGVLTLVAA